MTRYFFNVFNDSLMIDYEGKEFADDAEAREHAVLSARALICDDVGRGYLHTSDRIDVLDEHGREVMTVLFGDAIEIS